MASSSTSPQSELFYEWLQQMRWPEWHASGIFLSYSVFEKRNPTGRSTDALQSVPYTAAGGLPNLGCLANVSVTHDNSRALNGRNEIERCGMLDDVPTDDMAASTSETSIPLQTLSQLSSTSRSETSSQTQAVNTQNQVDQPIDQAVSMKKRVSAWIWHRSCSLWAWIVSVLTTALTVVTYLISKWQKASDKWEHDMTYRDYCQGLKDRGAALSSDCSNTLAHEPEKPPKKRDAENVSGSQSTGSSQSSWISEVFNEARRVVSNISREIERHISAAASILNADMKTSPKPFSGGGSVIRRTRY